jgi:hypothetical protein
MKVKGFIFFFLMLVYSQSYSQEWAFELWHDGKIFLTSGDTLKGLVKYDLQQDLVQYELPDVRKDAFTARKVLYFEIFDNTVHLYRKFFALPYNATAGYKTTMFFELLADGKMTLLCREALENRSYSSPYYLGSYTRIVLVYKYFLLKENGDIVEFTGNKNDLLKLMGKKSDDVEKYIRSNRLKFDEKPDLTNIVNYYNSLF